MASESGQVLQAGDSIADTYVVERFLAGGGMGSVYVARDMRLDRPIALKLLLPDLHGDAEATGRFQREAQMLSRIAHPNVVALHGFGRHGQAFYIAMEMVDGPSLEQLLEERGQLSVEETVTLARQIASALAEAHAIGVLHRDIKPGNVLVRRLATGALLAKVVDFGLARAFSASPDSAVTRTSRLLGTPAYMPPEQIQNGQLDGRADQYALAVLVYRMLAGAMPIHRGTTQGLLIAHLVDAPAHLPTLEGAEAGVRDALDAVLQRALQKRAEDRYGDVTEFAEALRAAVGGDATSGTTTSCPACGHRGRSGAAYCEACGGQLPLPSCPACNSRRHGERWFCVACGSSLRAPARWLLEERDATPPRIVAAVLAARLRGDDDPAAAAGRFASAVERAGGRMLAAIGSECIAVFGLGGMRDGEVEAAIGAGLDWLASARGSVGLTLGPLTTRAQAAAWGQIALLGPPVDAARALADGGETGQIRSDVAAFRELRKRYHGEREGDAVVIGRRRDTLQPAAGVAPREVTRLVGRFEALDELSAVARSASRRRALCVVGLGGERGSGRSRLLHESLQSLGQQGWRLLTTRATAYAGSAWQPFVDLMQAQLPARTTVSGDLAARVAALPGLADDGPERLQRRVGSLIRLGGAAERTVDLRDARPATEAEQAAAFEAYAAFVRGCIGGSAAVLAIDDVDCARGPSLELLAHLCRELEHEPVLITLSGRPAATRELLDTLPLPPSRVAWIDVPPLTEAETRELIAELLQGVAVPPSLAARVHEFAGGMPAMVEEAIEALLSADVIRHDGEGFRVATAAAIDAALERGLASLVLDRIGRLPPAERAILEAVAVAAEGVPVDMLSAMLDRAVSEPEIEALLRGGLLRGAGPSRFPGQREVELRQRLVGDALRDAVSTSWSRELHARASRWLSGWKGPRPPGFGAMSARHYLGAGDDAAATRALFKAAQESMRAFANRDAFDALGETAVIARRWFERGEEREARTLLLDALVLRAELGAQTGDLDAASEAADDALDLAVGGDVSLDLQRARALLARGEIDSRRGEYQAAADAFARATEVRTRGALGAGLAALATGRNAMVLLRGGEASAAHSLAERGISDFSAAPPTADVENGLGRMEVVLGHLATRERDVDAAIGHYERARMRFERGGDRIGAAMAMLSMGNAAYVTGDLDTAETRYRDAVTGCEAIEYVQGLTAARTNLGNVLLDKGEVEAAQRELVAAESAMRRMGALDLLPEALRLLALCRVALENIAGALSAATEAVAIARDIGNVRLEEAAAATLDEIEVMAFDLGS
ncbi:MAG: protein kinase [Deltaproteobacteria bacterium]|nr:protein kinase [Deltaproteobacteria bacterium]